MTAAVYRSTSSSSLLQAKSTASVHEFDCLYTHDLRRKQKRWQDGFLRFHTFNKRVMVYDLSRNFIGSAHWTADSELEEGDGVTLDKEAVMVEVAERIGRTETDLTPLRTSRKKSSINTGSSSPVKPAAAPREAIRTAPVRATQLKHRSLNALLGTPKGSIGKATLPAKSPFELRQLDVENAAWEEGRPSKRQRVENCGPRSGTTCAKTSVPRPGMEVPLWARTADSAHGEKAQATRLGQQRPKAQVMIDLRDDEPEQERLSPRISCDVRSPPSLLRHEQTPAPIGPLEGSSSPAFQNQKTVIIEQHHTASVQSLESGLGAALARPRNDARGLIVAKKGICAAPLVDQPRLQAEHRVVDVNESSLTVRLSNDPGPETKSPRLTNRRSGRKLHLAPTVSKKKTLLCQDQLSKKPKRISSTKKDDAGDQLLDAASADDGRSRLNELRRNLQERLERIQRRESQALSRLVDIERSDAHPCVHEQYTEPVDNGHASAFTANPQTHHTALETAAAAPTRLDQMLMPPIAPESASQLRVEQAASTRERALRPIFSGTNSVAVTKPKWTPGAPMRFTPSPAKRTGPCDRAKPPAEEAKPPVRLPFSRASQSLRPTVSLDVSSNGTSSVMLSKPFQPPKALEIKECALPPVPDPWSREAFDLFTWRPPDWDEENWCTKDLTDAVVFVDESANE